VSGGTSRVTPPSIGDVLLAARAYGWPALQGDGVDIAPGEAGWRAAVTPETAGDVWAALHDIDDEREDAADEFDDDGEDEALADDDPDDEGGEG
jgi:hypothetical protein